MGTYLARLTLGEPGCTVTIQNLTQASADYLKLWHPGLQQWTDTDAAGVRIELSQVWGDVYETSIDLSLFSPGTLLRLIYRTADLVTIADEFIKVDKNNLAIPDAESPLAGLLEVNDNGEYRITKSALELFVSPVGAAVALSAPTPSSVRIVYEYTQTLDPPNDMDIAYIHVHRAPTENSDTWPIVQTFEYTGQTELVFTSEFSGYFRLSYEDTSGNFSLLSDVFSAEASMLDLNFSFSLDSNSRKIRKGERRYVSINATEQEERIEVMPTSYISIYDETGVVVVDKAPAVIDGMSIKYLWDTTAVDPGTYYCQGAIETADEYLLTQKFKVSVIEE